MSVERIEATTPFNWEVEEELQRALYSPAELIRNFEDSAQVFKQFQQYFQGELINDEYSHNELTSYTKSGKLLQLWRRSGYRTENDAAHNFLLMYGNLDTATIEEALITQAVEKPYGDGARLKLHFLLESDDQPHSLVLSSDHCHLKIPGSKKETPEHLNVLPYELYRLEQRERELGAHTLQLVQ